MDEIQLQLQEMKQVLAHANEQDKPGLQMMIDQLEQLLHFQNEENLLTQAGSLVNDSTNCFDNTSNTNYTEESSEDAEFRRFQEEIAAMSSSNSSSNESKLLPTTNDNNNSSETKELNYEENSLTEETFVKNELIDDELSQLEGMLCRAPFVAQWGQLGYYNAIVLNVEKANSDCDSLDTIFVRVVFSNPVVEHMKPCQYFMEGHCKFDEEDCKFSHGEVVPLSHLKEYNEPDFQKIEKQSRVLAKYSDGLWYHATVSEIKEGGECIVKYDSYPETHKIPLHDTCVLHDDDNESDDSSLSSSNSDNDDDDDESESETKALSIDQLPLFQLEPTDKLGQWEQHTKGIGSKLMAKMGYVIGTGLGKQGEGRIEPVDAVIVPKGLSIDKIMEIKEKAGDQNLFSAAKKLKRQQRKDAQRAKKAEQKPKPKHESMFNFLNTKLSLAKDVKNLKKDHHVNIKELTKDSAKNLNRKALNLSEKIKQVNKDIIKVKEGLKRHEGNTTTVERIKSKLDGLENHLKELKKSESTIESEQRQRNDKKKLSIF